VTRRVAADWAVSAAPPPRRAPKPRGEPRAPRVIELLRKAREWQALLESGEVRNQADIARWEGITRARVTQIMAMLRPAPEIQESILSTPDTASRPAISELALRPIAQLEDPKDQTARFQELIERAQRSVQVLLPRVAAGAHPFRSPSRHCARRLRTAPRSPRVLPPQRGRSLPTTELRSAWQSLPHEVRSVVC
jgi:hypothetical protein